MSTADPRSLRPRWQRQSVVLVLVALVFLALYWWGLLLAQADARRRVVNETADRAAQMAELVALQSDTLFSGIDITLQFLSREFAAQPRSRFEDAVRAGIGAFPQGVITQVSVTDAAGMVLYSNLGFKPPVDLADREHIRVHFGANAPSMFVSAPVLGRISGKWTVQFTRPVMKAGVFSGVIVVSVATSYFSDTLARVALDEGDSIALVRRDGRWLSRTTDGDRVMSLQVPSGRPFLLREQQAGEIYRNISFVDGRHRLLGWRPLHSAPVVALVGLSEAESLRDLEDTQTLSLWAHFTGSVVFLLVVAVVATLISSLDRSRSHLSQAVAELTVAREAAEAASVAKSSFLANMSHEIRTPLNAMIGMAHLIRRGGLSDEQTDRLGKLEGAAAHLLDVLNSILDLSKIDAGKFTLEEQPLRVESIVANVQSILGDRAQEKKLRLLTQSDVFPRDLVGDSMRIKQALLNYANNAIKFTEHGSVTLRAKLLEHDNETARVRFEVEDTGPGIDPDVLPRLFSTFEQGDNSATRKAGGTGLGLAITRKFAELMGGESGVRSTLGAGSLFWFTVRLRRHDEVVVQPGQAESIDPAAELRSRHAGARVLLVEDNEINREVATAILEDAGLTVDAAQDGLEAVEYATRNEYDLILMDIQMPRMDGLEATRAIRRVHPGGTLPIIAITANAFTADKERCFEAGMDDFVSKPVEPAEMCATLLAWLDKRR